MANLRDMIDGRLLAAVPATPKQPASEPDPSNPLQTGAPGSYPSPAGKHVAEHMQDPYGATKDELDELNQAKMNYEMKKAQMQMKLQPVKSVVDGISQMHEMQDPNQQNPADAAMGYTDPNDPTGGGGGNMAMSPQGGATPGAMLPQQPQGMPGVPGLPPGQPKEAIRPLKLGIPQPGMGMPGQVAGMPGQPQMNPQAGKPPGAGQLPGAKGPGDPKVQNKVKKSQSGGSKSGGSNSTGKVAIHVHADSVSRSPAKMTLASYAGSDSLRSAARHNHADGEECDACSEKMKAYGTSEGVHKEWETRGHGYKGAPNKGRDKIQQSWQRKQQKPYEHSGVISQPRVQNDPPIGRRFGLKSYGTSDGVRKEWESRGRGKHEPITEIDDKRAFNAPIDKKKVSPAAKKTTPGDYLWTGEKTNPNR